MPDTNPVPVKPGWASSEFWLKVAAFALSALFAAGVIPTSGPVAQVAEIGALMLGALGYTVARAWVKTNQTGAASLVSSSENFARAKLGTEAP